MVSSRSISEFAFLFAQTSRSIRECLRLALQGALCTLPQLIESGLFPSIRNPDWGDSKQWVSVFKLVLIKVGLGSQELSDIVIRIFGWDGVAGVTDIMVGETWLVMVRRAGDADRDNRTEGLGVRNSSWITGISLLLWRIVWSFLSSTTEVTNWDSWFLWAWDPERYWECSLERKLKCIGSSYNFQTWGKSFFYWLKERLS